jgi:hypothetical protein
LRRYLLVEIVLGAIFLVAATVGLATGGATFPIRAVNPVVGFDRMLIEPAWDLIAIVAWHLTLICFLFLFAITQLDYPRIPNSLFWVGIVFGILLPLLCPCVQLINWTFPISDAWPVARFSVDQFMYLVLGATAGSVGGTAIGAADKSGLLGNDEQDSRKQPARQEGAQRSWSVNALFGMALVGVYLGWQSALLVAAYAFLIQRAISTLQHVWPTQFIQLVSNANTWLLAATLVHLMTWRWLNWI